MYMRVYGFSSLKHTYRSMFLTTFESISIHASIYIAQKPKKHISTPSTNEVFIGYIFTSYTHADEKHHLSIGKPL